MATSRRFFPLESPPPAAAIGGGSPTNTASRRLLAGTALGLVMTCANAAPPVAAQTVDHAPMQLPAVSVEGAQPSGSTDYRTEQPALPKLTAPLRETPQSITDIPRQLMDDQGVTTMRDALRNVPGISLSAGEASSQGDSLTLRGFTARNDFYLDGMHDFGSYYRDPFYLDRIEVLKGPSSILFGRGSTGGVIQQVSKTPLLDSFTAGSVALGTDMTKRVTIDYDRAVPTLGEGAALRINVMAHDSNVAGRRLAENTRFGLAPTLALGIGTPTRLTFSYLHQTEYDYPDYGLPWLYSAATGSKSSIAHVAPVGRESSYGIKYSDYLRTNVDVMTAKLEHDVNDDLSVRDQLRYAHYVRQFRITEPQIDVNGTNTPLLVVPNRALSTLSVTRNQLYGTSLETFLENQLDATKKFATGFIGHTVVAGIELGRETSDPNRYGNSSYSLTSLLSPDPNAATGSNTFLQTKTKTTALTQAVYALDTLKLNEQWDLIGGIRYDRFDAQFDQPTFNAAGVQTQFLSFHRVDEMPSYRAAVVFKPAPNGSIYFDYGTSFNPSAESLSLAANNAALAPVENETYELGSKWDVLDQKLSLRGAIYRSIQTNVRETDPNNALLQILAGNAKVDGFEFEAAGHLTEKWQIYAGYAYMFSEITSSPQNDIGHRLANVPMHTGNLWTTYDLPGNFQIGGGANYVSSRFASTTPTTAGGVLFWKEVPGYYTFSAMAKYHLTEKVDIQLNVDNIADKFYYDQIHPSHVVPGAGRTALLSTNFKF
jgi:catecholate siderophore receptor